MDASKNSNFVIPMQCQIHTAIVMKLGMGYLAYYITVSCIKIPLEKSQKRNVDKMKGGRDGYYLNFKIDESKNPTRWRLLEKGRRPDPDRLH